MNLMIRTAYKEELFWVNDQYKKVNFEPSVFENEVIALALINGKKAGLARLIRKGELNRELSGVLVLEPFRGKGIAKKLVEFIIHKSANKDLYCLAFSNLKEFYENFGFLSIEQSQLPLEFLEKFKQCNTKACFTQSVIPLKLHFNR